MRPYTSSAIPGYIRNPNMPITVPDDVKALDGAKPPVGTLLAIKLYMFFLITFIIGNFEASCFTK